MVAVLNLVVLFVSSVAFSVLYIVSVRPAGLTQRRGRSAYRLCGAVRGVAMLFEFIAIATYFGYRFFPPAFALPVTFGWPYWVSLLIAVVIGVPSMWLMIAGMIDAGSETAVPDPGHEMYQGIYRRMRHPQALGEAFLWFVTAFALNSPFLLLYSIVWLPVFYLFCVMEERDLLLRYGDAYAEYRRTVGMFLPRVGT